MMKAIASTSALLLAAGVSASPIGRLSARSALSCDNNASNGTVFSATSGAQYQVLCGTDFAGGDMGSTSTASFEDCVNACDSNSGCIDVSYVNGACYMKNSLGSPSVNSAVWTAKSLNAVSAITSSTTSTVSGSTSALTCDNNASDGTTYKTANGVDFGIYCATDFYGGDLFNKNTASFAECVELCSTTDSCVDVSFVSPVCYLKSTLTDAVARSWVWSAKLPSVALPDSYSAPAKSGASSSAADVASSSAPAVVSTTPVVVSTTPVVVSTTPVVVSTTPAVVSTTPAASTTPASSSAPTTSSTTAAASSSTSASTTTRAASSSTTTSATTTRAATTTAAPTTTSSASKTTSQAASTVSTASNSIFTVLSAYYGDLDVTQNVIKYWVTPRALIVDTFTTEFSLHIADPWFGTTKSIVILYSLNGKQQLFTANQYTIVAPLTAYYQSGAVDVSSIPAPAGSPIKVVGATWGANKVSSSSFFSNFYSSYTAGKSISFSGSTFGYSNLLNRLVGVVYYVKDGKLNAFVGRDGVTKTCT